MILAVINPRLPDRHNVINLVILHCPHGLNAASLSIVVSPANERHPYDSVDEDSLLMLVPIRRLFSSKLISGLSLGKMNRLRVYETYTMRILETNGFCTRFMVCPGRSWTRILAVC